jgi:hypothetical protein
MLPHQNRRPHAILTTEGLINVRFRKDGYRAEQPFYIPIDKSWIQDMVQLQCADTSLAYCVYSRCAPFLICGLKTTKLSRLLT